MDTPKALPVKAPSPSTAWSQWQAHIGEQISEHLSWLMGAARNIAPAGIDAEDLLSEAITKLLSLGAESTPHIGNVRSYLSTAMRNSVIDFSRSPASRVDAQDFEFFADLPSPDSEPFGVRSAELHQEFTLVRRAFAELDEEDQRLLDAVLVQGKPAASVGGQLGYKPATASTRVFRAKATLRRMVLLQHLRRGSKQCAENATLISGQVHIEFEEQTANARGMKHVRSCPDCQENWRRFAHMSQAFGVTTLLTVSLSTHEFWGAIRGYRGRCSCH